MSTTLPLTPPVIGAFSPQVMERLQKNPAEATIIIRADAQSQAGKVQDLIRLCQETGFERFSLRAKQKET